MRTPSVLPVLVPVLVGVLVGALSCKGPSKDEPPAKTEPVNVRPGPKSIERAKEGVQKANEAGVRRTEDAVDRAMQGEAVERGAPEPR
jgi:hypothetical protein